MKKPLPELEYLLEILSYDQDTGLFVWKNRGRHRFGSTHRMKVFNSKYAGKIAGCLNPDGYIYISILGSNYLAHRLAWKILTGEDPVNEIDHDNRVRSDNRSVNLRQADGAQNNSNTGIRGDNTSGVRGARWHKAAKKYVAEISVGRVRKHLGVFDTLEEASNVYDEATLKYHGEFSYLK